MELKNFGAHHSLYRCTHCHGIWCNAAQVSDLKHVPMIDVLDIGEPGRGAVYDQIKDIPCPQCGSTMESRPVPQQPHIDVEICKDCAGIFLDAGELKDAKHYTFGDWLRALKIKLGS